MHLESGERPRERIGADISLRAGGDWSYKRHDRTIVLRKSKIRYTERVELQAGQSSGYGVCQDLGPSQAILVHANYSRGLGHCSRRV
jgi:hypothetical protein